jgi:hypothetical protein
MDDTASGGIKISSSYTIARDGSHILVQGSSFQRNSLSDIESDCSVTFLSKPIESDDLSAANASSHSYMMQQKLITQGERRFRHGGRSW